MKDSIARRKPKLLAWIYSSCGDLLTRLCLDKEALVCYRRSLNIHSVSHGVDSIAVALIHLNIGNLFLTMNHIGPAIKHGKLALAIMKRHNTSAPGNVCGDGGKSKSNSNRRKSTHRRSISTYVASPPAIISHQSFPVAEVDSSRGLIDSKLLLALCLCREAKFDLCIQYMAEVSSSAKCHFSTTSVT